MASVSGNARGYYEPVMTRTFLPGCGNCGGAHPLARKNYVGSTTECPDCGSPVAQAGQTLTMDSSLSGFTPAVLIGRFLLWLGKMLTKFSQRI